jgi:hypothetical protein
MKLTWLMQMDPCPSLCNDISILQTFDVSSTIDPELFFKERSKSINSPKSFAFIARQDKN